MESTTLLFPFAEYFWLYFGFSGLVVGLLALDLGVFHKEAHEVSFREAGIWTAVWIGLALLFNLGLYVYSLEKFSETQARAVALEFLTGFVVEKSLAIDNIFVFAVVFAYFGIPRRYQHRVLFWGIFGALIFRAIFIAMGSILMQYHTVVILFGVFLILTGVKMAFAGTKPQSLENNFVVRQLERVFRVHPKLEGDAFWIKKSGVRYVTPLFLALVFLELSDILFAVDSVPAIFALTKEPLIVFTSNIFAILGLRSMYFMLSGVMDRFAYIKYGLAAVLVFVGMKMSFLNAIFDGKFPITWSLGIIAALIAGSMMVSVVKSQGRA